MSEGVSAEIEIAAPPEEVYAVMMDPGRLGEWVTIHREVSGAPDPPLAEGDSFEQLVRVTELLQRSVDAHLAANR